ncbi:MAG: CpcT/CpeT family chromophore lyase [Phycisphaerales bacterium]
MTMKTKLGTLLALTLSAGVAFAHAPGFVPDAAPLAQAAAGDAEKLVSLMTGTWKAKVGEQEVVMCVAPVKLSEVPNAMYVEMADAKAMTNPYRQLILQAYVGGGKLKLRTLVFQREKGRLGSVIGLWAAPDAFPEIKLSDLVGTLDLELGADGNGFTGRTAAPTPTSTGGAMSMTSELSVSDQKLSVADRGFDADGKVVWGPAAGEFYQFAKFDAGVKVSRFDGGVVVVDYVNQGLGNAAGESDQVVCNYVGYLADGKVFDRSFDRGEPLRFQKSTKLIGGANAVFGDTRKGMKRRAVIPASQAYGAKGRGSIIPPDATLYYDIEVIDVTPMPQIPVLDKGAPTQPPQGGGLLDSQGPAGKPK